MSVSASYDIVLGGRGGQGVIFLSRVIGQAALGQGLGVRTTETHGMAMRGGSVKCFVRLGSGLGPLFRKGSASLLMVLHSAETGSGLSFLSSEGSVIVNASHELDQSGIRGTHGVHLADADLIARQAGDPRSANLVLLGATVALVEGFPLEVDSLERAILDSRPGEAARKNLEIFRMGLGV
jgi:indolepyruvate ferredoxin oxidoreductase beta subunit